MVVKGPRGDGFEGGGSGGSVDVKGLTEKNGKNPGEEVKTQFALC